VAALLIPMVLARGVIYVIKEWAYAGFAINLVSALAVDLSRRSSGLAVFYASLYVRVRRLNKRAERCGACGRSRSQLHMAHELAGALQ
jgi:hypothetical protein